MIGIYTSGVMAWNAAWNMAEPNVSMLNALALAYITGRIVVKRHLYPSAGLPVLCSSPQHHMDGYLWPDPHAVYQSLIEACMSQHLCALPKPFRAFLSVFLHRSNVDLNGVADECLQMVRRAFYPVSHRKVSLACNMGFAVRLTCCRSSPPGATGADPPRSIASV